MGANEPFADYFTKVLELLSKGEARKDGTQNCVQERSEATTKYQGSEYLDRQVRIAYG
jgi:hypothetical protein